MKNLREYLEEQINENLIQATLSASRNKNGISKVKIRPIQLKGQICYQASATEGTKVLHKHYERMQLMEYLESEITENHLNSYHLMGLWCIDHNIYLHLPIDWRCLCGQ